MLVSSTSNHAVNPSEFLVVFKQLNGIAEEGKIRAELAIVRQIRK